MCNDAHKVDKMIRGPRFTQPTRRVGSDPMAEGNAGMWVQLGEESRNNNELLLETMQQLRI